MFLSTPPSRVATDGAVVIARVDKVSIHATLAGGDQQPVRRIYAHRRVSIHATLAGGDCCRRRANMYEKMFLSTPPSRVATVGGGVMCRTGLCFYPRHPRGWRPEFTVTASNITVVSIHATLAGGDYS